MAAKRKPTPRPDPRPDDNVLSAEDFFVQPEYDRLEIPEISRNGKPGVVYLRQLPAGDVLDYASMEEGPEQSVALLGLICKAVVTADGVPIFADTEDVKLRQIPIGAFNRLARAVNPMSDDENPSNEA